MKKHMVPHRKSHGDFLVTSRLPNLPGACMEDAILSANTGLVEVKKWKVWRKLETETIHL